MSRWDQRALASGGMTSYPAVGSAVGSGRLGTSYDSANYHRTPTAQPSYSVNPVNGTTSLNPAQQFTYNVGNPYAGKTSYEGPGPGSLSAKRFPKGGYQAGGGAEGGDRGRGRGYQGRGGGMGRGRGGGGRGGMAGPRAPKPNVIKPKAPPALSSADKALVENHNMKQVRVLFS